MSTSIFDLAEAVVEFAVGSESNWNNFQLPIPSNIAIYTTDSQKFKRGDGIHKYSDLPNGPTLAGIAAGGQEVLNILTTLLPTDTDGIIIINNEIYKASTTKLTDVVARISAIANKDTVQDANLATVASQYTMVDSSIISGDTGKLVVVGNHKMKPGVMPESMLVTIPAATLHIRSVGFYTDAQCTIPCDTFYHDSVYYGKINASHDVADIDSISFSLTETSNYVTTTALGRGLFKIAVGKPAIASVLAFTATVAYNTDIVNVQKSITLNKYEPILVSVYSGSLADNFYNVAIDSLGNIVCIGESNSEGPGYPTYCVGIIIKYDSNFNILLKKTIGGSTHYMKLNGIAIDSNDNIFISGKYHADTLTYWNTFILKYDTNLNILKEKVAYGTVDEGFEKIVFDNNNNIIAVGFSSSGGTNNDAIIYKFDTNLNIIARKHSTGSLNEYFYGVAVDSSNNIICIGYTTSEGSGGSDGLIVKFDSNLNILARKRYGGTGNEMIEGICIDSSNNIFCSGYTYSEGLGEAEALIIKLDSNLNVLIKKRYGGTRTEAFRNVTIDSLDNIICVGNTTTEGASGTDYGSALIVKFDNNLNIIAKKLLFKSGNNSFYGVAVDTADNIICSGWVGVGGGNNEAVVVKFEKNIPYGILTGTVMTDITFTDVNALTLGVSSLTFADSNIIFIADTLTYIDVTFTKGDSTLNQTKDFF